MVMIRISPADTKWAIAGELAVNILKQIREQLPIELQADGSRIVSGREGFAALLVFGGPPDERLAKQHLASGVSVYLLDFDEDAPVTLKLDLKKGAIAERRLNEHPAAFLEAHGIVAPGYEDTPSPVKSVGIVEDTSLTSAKRAMPRDADVRLIAHPRGVLMDYAPAAGMVANKLGKRGLLVFRNPDDGWFCCVVCEPGMEDRSYSPFGPSPNLPSIDNVLGETTLEGIVRVLAIPGELLGL
jgi:hypothetical protein